MTASFVIRPLAPSEDPLAASLLRELRDHLTVAELVERLPRLRASVGYELLGAFEQGRLVAVAGVREVETLTRGRHLHLDDLVVTSALRRSGIGAQLLRHIEDRSRERGLTAIFLDSRREVIGFYELLGFEPHTSILMRKRWRSP